MIESQTPYFNRDAWEMARWQALTNLQPYSKKQLTPTDVMKFKWDEEAEEKLTQKDIDKLDMIAKEMENKLNKNITANHES